MGRRGSAPGSTVSWESKPSRFECARMPACALVRARSCVRACGHFRAFVRACSCVHARGYLRACMHATHLFDACVLA